MQVIVLPHTWTQGKWLRVFRLSEAPLNTEICSVAAVHKARDLPNFPYVTLTNYSLCHNYQLFPMSHVPIIPYATLTNYSPRYTYLIWLTILQYWPTQNESDNVKEVYNFPKISRRNLKRLGTRKLISGNFQTEALQISDATVQNLVAWAIWRQNLWIPAVKINSLHIYLPVW
jgi:hypothetical protein